MMKWSAVLVCAAILALTAFSARAKDAKEPKGAKEHKVEIVNVKYKPAKITVKKGEKVVWINSDERDHTVVARDKEKSFDSGKIAAGEKFEFTFKKAGKFEYGCEFHPRMRGIVEVTD